MRRRTVYLILALSTVAGACSSDKKAAPSTSVSSASSATATSTTVPATTTTTTAPPPSIPAQPAGSPLDATNELIRAWKAGDHDAAAAVAVATVVDTLFAADPGSVQSRGCNQPPPDTPVLCVYRTGAGELQLRSSPVPGGWIVDQAMLTEGD
jgi:hypothetical protein